MSLWSDGSCVFLAGFWYPDSFDGTSARVVAIDLETEAYEVLTVDQPLFRIRDVYRGRVLVTTRTDDAAWEVHVYRHGLSRGQVARAGVTATSRLTAFRNAFR